jgi:hypothetical protein
MVGGIAIEEILGEEGDVYLVNQIEVGVIEVQEQLQQ